MNADGKSVLEMIEECWWFKRGDNAGIDAFVEKIAIDEQTLLVIKTSLQKICGQEEFFVEDHIIQQSEALLKKMSAKKTEKPHAGNGMSLLTFNDIVSACPKTLIP